MSLAGWDTETTIKRRLTFDSAQIDADLTDLVVSVPLSATSGKTDFDMTPVFDALTPLDVDNDFSGADGAPPDVRLWSVTNSSVSGTAEIDSNKLRISIPDTANDEEISIDSNFNESGDFDIELNSDMISASTPSSSFSYPVMLQIVYPDEAYAFIGVRLDSAGAYQATARGATAYTISTPTNIRLRLVRSGSSLVGYIWSGTQWEWNGSTAGYSFDSAYEQSTDVIVKIRVIADFDSGVTTDINSFAVNSGTVVWPETPKKIAFEIGDTGSQCYGEIVNWDYNNIKSHIEVKVPSVLAAIDSVLHFYADPAHADNTTYIGDTNSTPSDIVHADRDFVSHQAQDPSGTAPQILDSSPNAKHGTSYGSMTSGDLIDGLTGKAIDYDSTDDYTNHGYDPAHDITDVLSGVAVIKPSVLLDSGLTDYPGIISRQNDPTDSEDTYALLINADGKLHFASYGGNIQSTKDSWAAGVTYVLGFTYNATGLVGDLFVDGVKETKSVDSLDTMAGSTNNLVIGKNKDSTEFFPGMIDEVILINGIMSDAWFKAVNAALRDNLITFSLTSFPVLNALGQIYNLSDPVLAALGQDYNLTYAVKNALSQIWAHIIEVALNQHYGDADKITASLNQYYNDAPHVVQALIQKYDDMRQVTTALVQKHNLMFKAETALEQKWVVCGFQASAGLVQEYDLRLRDEVTAALGQYWGMFRDYQDVQVPIFWVMAEGVLLNPPEFTWTISASSSAIECTVPLVDHGVWRALKLKGALEIHWNGITYEFFIEEKLRTRSINNKEFTANYVLKGLSLTAGLEAPYAAPVTKSWPNATMASVIVAELAEGYEIDWQIDDFPVRGGVFDVNNQTPLAAIKALVGTPSVEAVVQSSPDGKIIVRREFKHSPTKWPEVVADHVIYDDGGVFSDSDDRDVMPGYNFVEITSLEESDSSKRLEKEKISATAIRVRGFSVPWQDTFPLNTSGGSNVSIVDNGIKTEAIPEAVVEFVDGVSSTAKPVYTVDLQGNPYPLAVAWMEDDLGAVSVDESGSMTSAVPGNSLAKITYLTKYREWIVQDQEIKFVQIFIPGEVEA